MRQAKILYKGEEAGLLIQHDDGSFTFLYHDNWMVDSNKSGISHTLRKNKQEHHSKKLFPFFTTCFLKALTKKLFVSIIKLTQMIILGY